MKDVVTNRARKILHDIFESFEAGTYNLEFASYHVRNSIELGDELIPAWVEALDDHRLLPQTLAAYSVLSLAIERPGCVAGEAVVRAESIFKSMLTGARDEQWAACLFLRGGGVTDALVSPLERLLRGEDRTLSIVAACALSRVQSCWSIVLSVLREALDDNDWQLAGSAGAALLRIGLHSHTSIDRIADRLRRPFVSDQDVGFASMILSDLKYAGVVSDQLAQAVAVVAANRGMLSGLRRLAYGAMGCLASSPAKVECALVEGLDAPEWDVLDGAIDGLIACHHFPCNAVTRLGELLSHDTLEIRRTAADGLRRMGSAAASTLPTLSARLREERDAETCQLIAVAIATVGDEGVATLIQMLYEQDVRTVEIITRALRTTGSRGAALIVSAIPTVTNIATRKLLVAALAMHWLDDAGAMRALARELDETEDDETAFVICIGFQIAGTSAAAAIPSLVRCIADGVRPETVRDKATQVLRALGPPAASALQQAYDTASDPEKARLWPALNQLHAVDTERFKRLVSHGRDRELWTFAYVGELLVKQGPMSRRAMERYFSSPTMLRRIPASVRLSQGTIRNHLQSVQTIPGFERLVEDGPSGYCITEEGRRALADVSAYLEKKTGRRCSLE